MRVNVFLCFMLFAFFSCSMGHEESPQQTTEPDLKELGIKLGGDEWVPSQSTPLNAMVKAHSYFGFKIYQYLDGQEYPFVSGIVKEADQIRVRYETGRKYKMEISYVSFSGEFEVDGELRLFNQSTKQGNDFDQFIEYHRSTDKTLRISPFSTYMGAEKNGQFIYHSTFPSDKFIGETEFWVEEESNAVEVDMYRFSAGIGFRIRNLEGRLRVILNASNSGQAFQSAVVYEFTPDMTFLQEIRPVREVFSDRTAVQKYIHGHPEGYIYPSQTFFRLFQEGKDGEEMVNNLFFADIGLKRNTMRIFELDMARFGTEGPAPGGTIILDIEDIELVDGGVVKL